MARGQRTWMQQAAAYSGLAFVLPAATIAGYVIGYLLDRAFGTHFLYIPFLILGTVGGFVQLIREVLKEFGSDDS